MNKAFGSEGIRKEYFAVVRGVPSERSWTAAMPIGKDERGEGPCKFRVDRERGKIAKTHFETIRALGHNCTLIRACPVTGRTHQIRVHLAACGLRLIGDKVYGTPDEHDSLDTVPGVMSSFPRQALHCALIGFEHPVSKKTTLIEAPIPHDMETLLGAIG
jgi:23S rRNA pseudouridine1911/1915/1917 synthase